VDESKIPKKGQKMVTKFLVVSILILIIVAFAALFFLKNIQNTRWWRMMEAEAAHNRKLESEMRLAKKYADVTTENQKNEFIDKIRKGEKVKIPYAAFDYIYRHIDEFGFLDENGEIVLVNEEAYKKIINKVNPQKSIEHKQPLEKNSNANYRQIVKAEDGTVTERNLNTNSFVVTTPDGRVTKTNAKGSIIVEEVKKEETNTKGQVEYINDPEPKYVAENEKNEESDKSGIDEANFINADKIAQSTQQSQLVKPIQVKKHTQNSPKPNQKAKKDSKKSVLQEFEDEILNNLEEQSAEISSNPKVQNEQKNNAKNTKINDKIFTTDYQFNYNEFHDFITSLNTDLFIEILMVILKKSNHFSFPVILQNNNNLYIDISYFSLCFVNSISDLKIRENFVENFFVGTKLHSLDNKNSMMLFEKINEVFIIKTKADLIQNWQNQDGKKQFISKRFFEYENKIYSSLMISIKAELIENLNLDIFTVTELEFSSTKKSSISISKNIFDNFLKI